MIGQVLRSQTCCQNQLHTFHSQIKQLFLIYEERTMFVLLKMTHNFSAIFFTLVFIINSLVECSSRFLPIFAVGCCFEVGINVDGM